MHPPVNRCRDHLSARCHRGSYSRAVVGTPGDPNLSARGAATAKALGGRASDDLSRLTNAAIDASQILASIDAEALASLGVTAAQHRVLAHLGTVGSANLVSLVQALDVTQSAISRSCDRLVKKGLVSRRASRVDRREVRLALTREGSEVLEALPAVRRQQVEAMVQAVSPRRRRQLIEALELLATAHREISGDGGPKQC